MMKQKGPMAHEDEARLVEQAKSDVQAFGALYDRYVNAIYRFAYCQTGDEHLAQDITSATFEKALRNIRRFRWQGVRFSAWLYRIAHNEIRQHFRRWRFLVPLSKVAESGPTSEETFQQQELYDSLHRALFQLSASDREIISLRYFEGLSSPEVAHVLGCSADNVYLRLHRALGRLRKQMDSGVSTIGKEALDVSD
jgi:RNA polymerase sigma-70 factor (ECF subfamily)